MDQFVYTDIFETKGIEYIIVIGFLFLIIPFWMLLNKPMKLKQKIAEGLAILSTQVLRIPRGLFYNKNHTWSHLERSGLASVGMDDLLLHLTGGIELEYLKEMQEKVKRGEPIARISQNGKNLVITSPLSGEVEGIHSSLLNNSEALSQDPYSSWLYRIKPQDWRGETSESLMADEASEWAERELERFKDFLAESVSQGSEEGAVVLQAGGELIDHPLSEMDQVAWEQFQDKFLNVEG